MNCTMESLTERLVEVLPPSTIVRGTCPAHDGPKQGPNSFA